MPSDESKGSQLDAIGSLAQRQLDNTFRNRSFTRKYLPKGHPLLSHLGKQAVDSFRSFEEALVTEDQEYDVIALPEQRRWQPVPRD